MIPWGNYTGTITPVGDYGGLYILDLSDLSNPIELADYRTAERNTIIELYGNYAYVADNTDGLEIIDIGGAEISAMHAGNIEANDITVTENLDVGNSLYVGTGLNVGPGGILADGPLAVDNGTLVVDGVNQRVGIGTKTPTQTLTVAGDLNVTGTSYLGDVVD